MKQKIILSSPVFPLGHFRYNKGNGTEGRMKKMEIKQIVTGTIEENCYLISQNDEALLIDPGDEASKIKNEIEELGVRPLAILLTHTHYDHIGAVEELRHAYHIPVYVSPLEQEWLGDPVKNFSASKEHDIRVEKAEYEWVLDKEYQIGPFEFIVLPTPGHSPGSVSLLFSKEGVVFTGDALFKGSVGRTDLPGCEPEKLLVGIQTHLFTLPDHFRVFPGHRADSTIGHEKKTNPFFN